MTRVPRPADHITVRSGARPVMAQPVVVPPVVVPPVLAPPVMAPPVLAPPKPAPPVSPSSLESLYPFLYAGETDLSAVLADATASTLAKTREIMKLRAEVGRRSGAMLVSCARAATARFAEGGRLLAFGNGGSATDAQQLVSLFLYPGCPGVPPLPAISLACDVAVVTSLANDVGIDVIFARQLAALGRPGDIAVGLSTSGNSENLVRAFDEASRRGLMTVGIAGYDGGKMAELDSIDYLFVAPSQSIHRIQEAQTTIYHVLWELITAELGRPGR